GINWTSPIHIYKVFDKTKAGKCEGTNAALIKGITSALNHALAYKINFVINYSGGQTTDSNALQAACKSIDDFNTNNSGTSQAILCAATGNGINGVASNSVYYPAKYSTDYPNSIVGVGASDANNEWTTFSNYGAGLTLLAPGKQIYSTMIGSTYGYSNGTSMSAPIVSGIISLIWSHNKSLSARNVIDIIKQRAVKLDGDQPTGSRWGSGVVSALWDDRYFASRLSIDTGTNTNASAIHMSINIFNLNS
ncbi:MAG: S8 family serine peptidase, partial [Psychrosphaera sp.]|nr:S8 family serine peptidase [Psychrosphaera sp.]